MVRYYTIAPPASIAHFVRCFWVFEMDLVPGQEYIYRSMADSCTEILFHYKGSFHEITEDGLNAQPYGLLHAQSKTHKRFITKESFGIFGAFLYPYVIPFLFNVSSLETADHLIGLDGLCGNEGRLLEEQMMLAKDNWERIHIFSAYLHKKLWDKKVETGFAACVQKILTADKWMPVKELAAYSNISQRQLERKFKDYVGFSPKLFSRIVRFQSSLKEYKPKQPLTHIAYDCGYYDQSHFIHDFKQFSGYHPKQYFHGRPEGIEWREA
jgi:AraC-like DNA-binding protein